MVLEIDCMYRRNGTHVVESGTGTEGGARFI